MNKNLFIVFISLFFVIGVSGFLGWLFYTPAKANHQAVLGDFSFSSAGDRCGELIKLSEWELKKAPTNDKTKLMAFLTGDKQTANEPRSLGSFDVPLTVKLTESNSSVTDKQSTILGEIKTKCEQLLPAQISSIFLAFKRAVEHLRSLGCDDTSNCEILAQTDLQENAEPQIKTAIPFRFLWRATQFFFQRERPTQRLNPYRPAGYDYALVIVSNQKKLPALNAKLLAAIPFEHKDKVKTFSLPGLLAFLRELTQPKTVKKGNEKPAGQRLDLSEASGFLGISASTLYRWAREGRIPFYRVGREYRFDRDELVLIGKQDLSGKRKATVKLSPVKIEKNVPKNKKEQNVWYRKMLKLD